LIFRDLNSLGIEMLVEISLAVQQGDSAKSQAQIGCGPHRVSREHTQSPAIGGHLGCDGDFHREVRYDTPSYREAVRRKIALLVRKMHPAYLPS
jgi:hypothetical protein